MDKTISSRKERSKEDQLEIISTLGRNC